MARTILVVDDNVDTALSMALVLRKLGHTVDYVTSGHDALHVARRTSPEVVLLDLGLPDVDGYSVVRQLRKVRGLEETRIIAITGKAADDNRERSLSMGFDEHFTKPLDPARLDEIIS
jgi:CheY-like chemotaxis protein